MPDPATGVISFVGPPDAEVRKRVKALLESLRDDEVNHGGLLSRRSLMLANQTQLEMTRPRVSVAPAITGSETDPVNQVVGKTQGGL